MTDQPVPEAAVEAAAAALWPVWAEEGELPYMARASEVGMEGLPEATREAESANDALIERAVAAALSAALDTGTLIAIPTDEQGQRELVERQGDWLSDYFGGCASEECTHDTVEDCKASRPWDHTARGFLQALGLLPEPEAA